MTDQSQLHSDMTPNYFELLNAEQLNILLDDILSESHLRRNADFIIEATINQYTKAEIYKEFTKAMVNWYLNLKIHLATENFELCAKLRDVIEHEKREFLNDLRFHLEFTSQEEEAELIEDTDTFIKNIISQ